MAKGYGHIGRPTNEEVAPRKRKQMLKIFAPIGIIIAVVSIIIVRSNGLNGLMGDSVDYDNCSCDSEWEKSGNICYQEQEQSADIVDAYLLGDVVNKSGELVPDGEVTLQDWNIIKKAIESGVALDNVQQSVYDLNGDGVVDENDVSSYETSSTGELELTSKKYVCPKEKTEETETDGIKTIIKTTYELTEDSKCNIKTVVRKEKEAVCSNTEISEEEDSDFDFEINNTDETVEIDEWIK